MLEACGNKINYRAPVGTMTNDLKEAIKNKKKILLKLLCQTEPTFGQCEICPAGGEYDWAGSGLWCFHSAYFLGKAAKPIRCAVARTNCPLG
jgi:hypothetical protein